MTLMDYKAESVLSQEATPEDRIMHRGGWIALEQTLRKADEEKVKDCKDDMDTLLVFAGLYSAVLTAFLIESYKNLQEDPHQVTNQLLRQISAQTAGYTAISTFFNATTTVPPPPTFHAAIPDIRVNVCWFASLIFSLSAASFAMLVKQWLREYLAIKRTASHERVRIRHFRYRGLEDWKLFEIAAALPLFLQLSLGLFFIGLCFFTTNVHISIAITSTILVYSWGALFVMAITSPLWSSRCPYKTTFLRLLFKKAREIVRATIAFILDSMVIWAWPLAFGTIKSGLRNAGASLRSEWNALRARMAKFSCKRCRSRRATRVNDRGRSLDVNAEEECCPDDGDDDLGFEFADGLEVQQVVGIPWQYGSPAPAYPDPGTSGDNLGDKEEEDICRSNVVDLLIFDDLDAVLVDDLLLNAMREIIPQFRPSGEAIVAFVLRAINRRLGRSEDAMTLLNEHPLDLRTLPQSSWVPLMNILGDALLAAIQASDNQILWHQHAFELICYSLPPCPHPSTIHYVLQEAFVDHIWLDLVFISPRSQNCTVDGWDMTSAILSNSSNALENVSSTNAWNSIVCIVPGVASQRGNEWEITLQMLDADPPSLSPRALHILIPMILDLISTSLDTNNTSQWQPWMDEAFDVLYTTINASAYLPGHLQQMYMSGLQLSFVRRMPRLFPKLFSPQILPSFFRSLSGASHVLVTELGKKIFNLYNWNVDDETAYDFLASCEDFFAKAASISTLSVLRLSNVVCTISTNHTAEVTNIWHRVFESITLSLNRMPLDHLNLDMTVPDYEDVYHMLQRIDAIDKSLSQHIPQSRSIGQDDPGLPSFNQEELEKYSSWCAEFDDDSSFCPNDFVQTLFYVVDASSRPDVYTFWRMKMLLGIGERRGDTGFRLLRAEANRGEANENLSSSLEFPVDLVTEFSTDALDEAVTSFDNREVIQHPPSTDCPDLVPPDIRQLGSLTHE